MKIKLRLIRARPTFCTISDKTNISVVIVDCSLYISRFALKDDCHNKRVDMLAYIHVEFNYLETLSKTFIIPAGPNQLIHRHFFINAPVRRNAFAMNTKSAFSDSYTENPFWYQQFDLRPIKVLRGGKPIVDNDAANNCRLYVTTIKGMKFQDDIPSIPIDNIKGDCVLVFHLISMQAATENLSLLRTIWITTEAGAKFRLYYGTLYWTHCIGRTTVFGYSLQVWCCWKN